MHKVLLQRFFVFSNARLRGFSLVEIMVALIVISCITAALVPVITKKMKSKEISISSALKSGGAELSKVCTISNCSVCSKDNATCYVCKDNYRLEENACTAITNYNVSSNCTSYNNCIACTNSSCVTCESGYYLNASNVCEEIPASTDVSAVCTDIANCSMCYGGKCLACESGYELIDDGVSCSNDATREITSQEDCNPFNALYVPASYNGSGGKGLCVTRYNIGDPGGPPLDPSVKSIVHGACSVTSAGTNDANALCCWQGRTSGSCTEDDAYGSVYSGCNRTVCQRGAAKISCQNWEPIVKGYKISGWRLPTSAEATGWKNNISNISRKKGQKGLQFCAQWPTDVSMSIHDVQCATLFDGCKGASNGDSNNQDKCFPFDVWHQTGGMQVLASSTVVGTFDALYAFSGRCVIDSLPKNFVGSKSSNFAAKNTKRSLTVYGEPVKQADCDPFNAIFVPRKYNGSALNSNYCVTKYDVGAPGGPPLLDLGGGHVVHGVWIVPVGETCSAGTCVWVGQTAKNCTDGSVIRGSTCSRPVMGIHAASNSCSFWNPLGTGVGGWHLPSYELAHAWATAYNNNADGFRDLFSLDSDGLNFCAESTTDSNQLQCTHRTTSCPGAVNNECWPSRHWVGGGAYMYSMTNATWMDIPGVTGVNWAFAARCVSNRVPIR